MIQRYTQSTKNSFHKKNTGVKKHLNLPIRHYRGRKKTSPPDLKRTFVMNCERKQYQVSGLSCRRFGSRIDAPSGRSARRQQTCSALPAHYFLLITVYRSFIRQQLTTVYARFTQTTRAGLQPGCQVCLSFSFRRRSAVSLQWRSHCRSAAWEVQARRRLVPWVSPTWRLTARPCSRITYTSPRFRAWFLRHSRARQAPVHPRNSATRHRQTTCGAVQV